MSDRGLSVLQFVHPGFEYSGRKHLGPRRHRSGVMPWKPGRAPHDRKFILSRGSLFDARTGTDHASEDLVFWGEWEGPSVFWRVESPGKPLPSALHAPFLPAETPTTSVQNTDPMVFGDAFIYSNCLQATYRTLRELPPGSMVLFGRYARPSGRASFSLDTCLVVDTVEKLDPLPFAESNYGSDLLTDTVLSPLFTEGGRETLSVYRGVRRSAQREKGFSFFPARLMDHPDPLFARPELKPTGALEGVISPGNMQGIKVTSGLTAGDRDLIWEEVAGQVTRAGCGLGHHAVAPPALSSAEAERVARAGPTAFGR
jgi:hypothetical protein